jgi:hypothetical protein
MFRNDNFEHADLGQYDVTTGTPTFVTNPPAREGIRCLNLDPAGAAESVQYNLPAGKRVASTTFLVRLRSLPATFTEVNFGGPVASLRYHAANLSWNLVIAGAVTVNVGPSPVVAGIWYLIDLACDSSTGTTEMKGRVNGGTEAILTFGQAAVDIGSVLLGNAGAPTFNMDFDLWRIGIPPDDAYPLSGLQAPGNAHTVPKRHARSRVLIGG